MTQSEQLPIEITVNDLDVLRRTGADFVLLDVREVGEYETARIEGSRLLPMSELATRLHELEPVRDQHIVVQCHHGGRSMHVTNMLRQAGFTRVQNLGGGIDQWSLKIDSSVPRY